MFARFGRSQGKPATPEEIEANLSPLTAHLRPLKIDGKWLYDGLLQQGLLDGWPGVRLLGFRSRQRGNVLSSGKALHVLSPMHQV